MSVEGTDTESGLLQFMHAYEVELIAADGQPRLDDPAVRQKIIRALTDYTTVHRKGCTPPDAVHWGDPDNNKNFHDQKVVMTINTTLSIPNAMIETRPDDYYKNTTTLAWPDGPDGNTYTMETGVLWAIVFQQASNAEQAKDFLRFLLSEERLGTYLEASLARALPTMPALLDRPFWKDPADPHRRRAVEQLNLPSSPFYANVNWRYGRVEEDEVWQKAVRRVAVDGLSPEQAADEAIARVKQILSE
jgi:multiple sugar transport system substrate-binding protein